MMKVITNDNLKNLLGKPLKEWEVKQMKYSKRLLASIHQRDTDKKKQILGYDQTSWLRLSSMMRNPSSHLVLKYGILSQNHLKYEKMLSQIFIGAIVKNFQEKRRLL